MLEREIPTSMDHDDIDEDELADRAICSDCIGEQYLKTKMEQDGIEGKCNYCGKSGKTISIKELAHWVDKAIDDHFQRTSDQPDIYEYAALRDKESDYIWLRHGEPVTDVISEMAHIDDEPAEHIRQILDDYYYDIDEAAMGEENPYDPEAHYEEKDGNDYELRNGWTYFQKSLKTETRLFNREAEKVLASIFEGMNEHLTDEFNPVIVDVGRDCHIEHFYRARVFQSSEELEKALCRPDLEIGPPPFSSATAGRMNARGISVFYGATEPGVALAEVRPPVGSRVVVARFTIVEALRLLDVEALRSIYVEGSLFDSSHIRRLEKAKFLRRLSDHITMPVMPEDESADYLVTQAIADYLASMEEPKLDGIIYRSIQNGGQGRNVALFHKSSRVEALSIPEGMDISALLVRSSDEGPQGDYLVLEEVPDEHSKKGKDYNDFFSSMEPPLFADEHYDDDLRSPTLRVDLDTVVVHHIRRINVDSRPFPVRRSHKRKIYPKD